MSDLYDIIRRPVITEKTSMQKDANGKITFEVNKLSNRIEIARAIEKIFNVKVSEVRTMRIKGKSKRKGRVVGKRRDWKKAIVTLGSGERIDFFEGA